MRKSLLYLAGAALIAVTPSCAPLINPLSQEYQQHQIHISTLEKLCDAPITQRQVTVHLYVSSKPSINAFREHKDEILKQVKRFYKQYSINLNFQDSPSPSFGFYTPNEIEVDILGSKDELERRFNEFSQTGYGIKFDGENVKRAFPAYTAVTSRVVMINEESKTYLLDETTLEILREKRPYLRDLSKQEIFIGATAKTISHEIAHLFGLPHQESMPPLMFPLRSEGFPNLMAYNDFEPTKDNLLGSTLTSMQIRIMHKFLADDSLYNLFKKCHDPHLYVTRLAEMAEN